MPEEQIQDRQVAYKVRINDLINGQYVEQEGWNPNYVLVNEKKISRVNIIGSVIDTQIGENLSTITIDDGSGNIQVRAFKEESFKLKDIQIGDVVIIVGRPRRNFNQYFISYEIVKKIDPLWSKVRLKELGEAFEQKPSPKENVHEENASKTEIKEESYDENRKKILELIKSKDEGNGAEIEEIILNSNINRQLVENIIQELIKDGEIYENIAGKVKIL